MDSEGNSDNKFRDESDTLHRINREKSFDFVEGEEGKPLSKNQYLGRNLGVFTSGGDAQGK